MRTFGGARAAVMVLLAGAAIASAAKFNVITVTEQEIVTVTMYVTAGGPHEYVGYRSTFVTETTSSTPSPTPVEEEPSPTVEPESFVGFTPPAEPQPEAPSVPSPEPEPEPEPSPQSPASPAPSVNLAPPTSQSGAPSENDPAFVSQVLQVVNDYRQQHGANPLSWDASLATYARGASDGCKMEHTKAGENIYSFGGSGAPDFTSQTKGAIDAWMSEAPQYSGDGSAGHFTQVVWKDSQKIGCGWNLQSCSDGNFYFYCEFDPFGNVIGQYSQNVS